MLRRCMSVGAMTRRCVGMSVKMSMLTCLIRTFFCFFFFSSRRRHTRLQGDWSSDVCSSDLAVGQRQRFGSGSVQRKLLLELAQDALGLLPCSAGNEPLPVPSSAVGQLPDEIGRASCRERV